MKTRYYTGDVVAKRDTADALLCSFDWSDELGYVASDMWIPKSNIHEGDYDTIDEAFDGQVIEISVAAWWLDKQF